MKGVMRQMIKGRDRMGQKIKGKDKEGQKIKGLQEITSAVGD